MCDIVLRLSCVHDNYAMNHRSNQRNELMYATYSMNDNVMVDEDPLYIV